MDTIDTRLTSLDISSYYDEKSDEYHIPKGEQDKVIELFRIIHKQSQKLKEENEVLLDTNVNIKLLTENQNVKEMNERLDKRVGELKVENRKNVCWYLHNALVKEKDEIIKKLKEENEELFEFQESTLLKIKEQIGENNTHDSCCGCDVCEENDKLKEEIGDLRSRETCRKAETEKLKKLVERATCVYSDKLKTQLEALNDNFFVYLNQQQIICKGEKEEWEYCEKHRSEIFEIFDDC
jgi:hypothetical protein